MKPQHLMWIHTVAEDCYRALTQKDWRRFVVSRSELSEMLTRLDSEAKREMATASPFVLLKPTLPQKASDPGASPADFWGC